MTTLYPDQILSIVLSFLTAWVENSRRVIKEFTKSENMELRPKSAPQAAQHIFTKNVILEHYITAHTISSVIPFTFHQRGEPCSIIPPDLASFLSRESAFGQVIKAARQGQKPPGCLLAGRLAAAQMTSLRPENRPAVPKALFEHLRRRRGHQLFRSTTPAGRKQRDWSATNTAAETTARTLIPPKKTRQADQA